MTVQRTAEHTRNETTALLRELSDASTNPGVAAGLRETARSLLQDQVVEGTRQPSSSSNPERAKTILACCALGGTALLAAATVLLGCAPHLLLRWIMEAIQISGLSFG